MQVLSGTGFRRLEQAVQAGEMRQKVISNNIANADTPNFKRSEVLFEELLQGAAGANQPVLQGRRTNARHIAIGPSGSVPEAQRITDEHDRMNNNANNVDIDREMALLAQNQLGYNVYIQQISHDVKMMRTAIEGR
ncbi:flagellar basal body rod protein FlgB [Paenibacillus humicola]|uniref:flagellar basal body rod protein FlgB n=1 Tax=Paenibacillus humicola TaxID=3110540 RepID=UPI00237A28F1|nr:flagellar basal body rod protein FlgB [Paenibacillus humicola]